jgi:hypothetical protein
MVGAKGLGDEARQANPRAKERRAAQPDSEQFRSSPRTLRPLWRMTFPAQDKARPQSAEGGANIEGGRTQDWRRAKRQVPET